MVVIIIKFSETLSYQIKTYKSKLLLQLFTMQWKKMIKFL